MTERLRGENAAHQAARTFSTPEQRIEAYLRSVGITQPVRSFLHLVSNTYHGFESAQFDKVHIEIHESAPYWEAALRSIQDELPPTVRVLDIGAGTGFASTQLLRALAERVDELVCFDLSRDMLARCRARITPLTANAAFVSGELATLLGGHEQFDLVITSAMLHHVLDLPGFFEIICKLVRPGGFYLAGHEPSSLFYANQPLYRWTKRYRVWRRLQRALSPTRQIQRLRGTQPTKSIEQRTNEELLRIGAIPALLPAGVILQLVDIHVPPARPDIPFWGSAGFNAPDICRELLPGFELYSVSRYPSIKDARARMGLLWRTIDTLLRKKYPNAGANFFMVARRMSVFNMLVSAGSWWNEWMSTFAPNLAAGVA